MQSFNGGGVIFLKKVSDPQRFGVAEMINGRIQKIVEKPKNPSSNLAVTGLYQYDNSVFEIIKYWLTPSGRGELEITDVNNCYINRGAIQTKIVKGFWSDAGTFDSLAKSINWALKREK